MTKQHWHWVQADPSNYHVYPCGDSIEHQLTDECPCNPRFTLAEDESNDGDTWVNVHQAADGRPMSQPTYPGDSRPRRDPAAVIVVDRRLAVGVAVGALVGLGWLLGRLVHDL